jgi:hypothetical protein
VQDAVAMVTGLLQEEGIFKIAGDALFSAEVAKKGWTEEGHEVLKKLNAIAEKMVKHAFTIGSCDNITVTVMLILRNPSGMPPNADRLASGDDEYPNFLSGGGEAKRAGAAAGPGAGRSSGVTLVSRPVPSSGLMSPGKLSSEIMAALDDTDDKSSSKNNASSANPNQGSKSSVGGNRAAAKSADQDDDLMSFLLDDSNF